MVMLGASGAAGLETNNQLLKSVKPKKISSLGRRKIDLVDSNLEQHEIDIFKPESYSELLSNHEIAICTLGVGEPSKISKEDFIKIDKSAVLDFAKACKNAGVQHFQLLSSVGISAKANNYYLRTKGELVEEIKELNFERFSVFQPSMILTTTNRYGFSQGLVLKVWPVINYILVGSLSKYKGVKVAVLGKAIANNVLTDKKGVEFLAFDGIVRLVEIQI